jgi:hypothetical protein
MDAQPKRAPWLWPLVLMIVGVVLLLSNFLLLDVDVTPYWPVLLVLLGVQLLLRGDIALSWQAHSFGITRGSVQSASLEIESGELDVQVRALRKPGRLIAGQYTARSRPGLNVRNNHATLRMQRGQTWWLSLADWDVGLAQDLPWGLLVSSYLGRLEIDLRGLRIDRVYAASGIGSVNLACPQQAAGVLFARSTFGDVRLSIPEGSQAVIRTAARPLGRVRVDPSRFRLVEPGVYATVLPDDSDADSAAVDLNVTASTVFGSIYIN